MSSVALATYLVASRLADGVARPVLLRRLARGKEDPARIGERLGHPGVSRPTGPLVWLHGASVGEAMSSLPLIAALTVARPDIQVLLTTGTLTSARRMTGALPKNAIHQFVPVDTASAVRRFLDHWRPDLAIWIESELWPRLIIETGRRHIPMALVNARLSAGSHARWRRLPRMARALLGRFGLILAQDHETVDRLSDLGCNARFAGNLKAAVEAPHYNAGVLADLSGRLADRPVWLAASTHPGEEEIAIDAHSQVLCDHPGALLILAPRHPERGDQIADLLRERGLAGVRRSAGQIPDAASPVWLADTFGEMGLWYRLAAITFVGGTMTDRGGHTPFEPAQCGSAIVHGPDTRNFAPAYQALSEAGGALQVTPGQLGATVSRLFRTEAAPSALADAARDTARALNPDTGAIARELLDKMNGDRA